MSERKRSTAVVDTKKGILIVSHSRRHKNPTYMLPGGGIKRGERSISAANRELYEETGLHSADTKHLFDFAHHKVFLIKTYGRLRKRHEITHIRFYNDHTKNRYKLAWHVKPIVEKYKKKIDSWM